MVRDQEGFCAQFVELCRKMGLLTKASVAIDGSKFQAVNSRDNNFTQGIVDLGVLTLLECPSGVRRDRRSTGTI